MARYLEEKHNIMSEASDYQKKDIDVIKEEIITIKRLISTCKTAVRNENAQYSKTQYILITNILKHMDKEKNLSIKKRKSAKKVAKNLSTNDSVTSSDKKNIKAYKKTLKQIEKDAKSSLRKIDNTKINKYKGKVKNFIGGKRYNDIQATVENITKQVVSGEYYRDLDGKIKYLSKRNEEKEEDLGLKFIKGELGYKSNQSFAL